jgi:signal transduction histidine kinase
MFKIKKSIFLQGIVIILILIASVFYLRYKWVKISNEQSNNVLQIARTIEVSIPKDELKVLEAKPEDIEKPQYKTIKNILKEVVRVNGNARFAYIFSERNGKIYFYADSENEGSENYSPPGQEYKEAKDEDRLPFSSGKVMLTSPLTDRWGTWRTAYIPMIDSNTGKVFAVFGMDFDASNWNRTLYFELLKSSVMALLLVMSMIFLIIIRTKNNLLNHQIKKRKLIELDLVKAKERAEESDRLKSAFLSNMSHEIRTPMNGILGFASLLTDPNLTGEQQKEFVQIIKYSGNRMLNIINDIISISKIESGTIEINLSESNVNEQFVQLSAFFEPEAKIKGTRIVFDTGLSIKKTIITTDTEKLYAILANLIKNAVKFTSKGIIEIGYVKRGEFLEFFVKDNGPGISPHQKEIIFERFRQGSELMTRNYEGAGLGLSISKAYVEILGGKIWVESEEGKGSTFYFTIPYHNITEIDLRDENAFQHKDSENQLNSKRLNLKVLIAEDDETSEKLITLLVEQYSREILKAHNGLEAVESFVNNPDIDLILMDIRMPVMGGSEATRQIRQLDKNVVIIAQTAYGLNIDRDKALEAGCNDYVSKPVLPEDLQIIMEKHFKK